mgnify:FL=1
MKLKVKKIRTLLVLALMLSMILTGCGSSGGQSRANNNSRNSSSETIPEATKKSNETDKDLKAAKKIVVFQSKVEITDQLEAMAKDYESETGVQAEVWGTTGDDYL